MKNIIITLLAGFLAAGLSFALDLELSGEFKTGFYSEWKELEGETTSHSRIYNNDDAGAAEGRLRIGINLMGENFGLRTQFSQENFRRGTSSIDENLLRIDTDFAFAFIDVLDSQFRISAGLLGESPWGTGGPYLFHELESVPFGSPVMGLRTEWKPRFVPGLNLGFVLNKADDNVPPDADQKFGDIFLESILGIAWENDYFAFRFAYRIDRAVDSPAAIRFGDRLTYRIEARVLGLLVPDLSVWANGFGFALNTEGKSVGIGAAPGFTQHWLYVSYDPEFFNAGINVGYRDGFIQNEQQMAVNPFIYGKFFNDFLTAGFMCGMEFGFNNGKAMENILYNSWFIEPQIQVNINSNLYAAVVYRYTSHAFESIDTTKDNTTQWLNLRLVYSF